MTLKVRVLKNDRDYEAAMERMSALMSIKRPAGSEVESEFELLSLVIGDYEARRVSEPQVTAVQAIEFRMAQQQLTRKDLEPYLGSSSKVSEVMSGKLPLSIQMIRRLHNGLGIPARALIADVSGIGNKEDEAEPDLDHQKFPLKEMTERGMLPVIDGRGQKAKEQAAAEVRKFLTRIADLAKEPAFLRARLFQSGARTMDDCALLVWRAAVVQKANRFPPKKAYVPGVVTNAWLRKLAQKSKHENGPKLAREYLSAHGICLVVEERFKKTYLDGAAMMAAGTPIVALTLRHDRLDNFWFALLHEMVHIQKHLTSAHLFIADNLDDKARRGQVQEDEADAGAQEALIPTLMWEASRVRESHSAEDAIELAREAGVHPCIVAGRVRHCTGNWRLLSSFITAAGSVKPYFEDQLQ
jgi:HTH-type transcriptional regulator/antitoxin HigA